ncbi:MAG TPA: glycosyltransferase family 4 protein [Pirellulales bacterium]|nr:glycosyltransferase family 4 protein [Pirellulales bacterium]
MKIGLVIESLEPRRGGAEQWTAQFATWLARAGHEVHIVASQVAPEMASLGLMAHPLPRTRSRLEFAQAAEQQLERLSLDVTHDMGYGWQCDVFQPHGGSRAAANEQNLHLAPRWLRPIKRRVASCLPRYREFRRLAMAQYMADDRIYLALSRMVARDFERFHGVRREQIRLVYNGVDVERFSPEHRWRYRAVVRDELGVDDRETLLLIVAHNFRLKGVPTLLAAVGKLVRAGLPVRLAVVGGKRQPAIARLAARLGAANATTFVGPVDDAVPYYAAADVYVQPTFYDPCSLVVLEAWACGLPVITSRFNGAGELMTPGVEGWLIDNPADADELTARLLPLTDPAIRAPMALAARRLAVAHSFDRNCRELLTVYGEICAAGRRRAA